jgi:hypothetical protein
MTMTIMERPLFGPALTLAADAVATSKPSRVQVAETGDFQSDRYGVFSITRRDLEEMIGNFVPMRVPADFDHMSMSPRQPGDGKAAGWLVHLEMVPSETAETADKLFAEVVWTPKAAQAIKDGEWRFISPSFVKDHVDNTGAHVGTKLLAIAITNHPFLDKMQPVSLDRRRSVLALSDGGAVVGQHVQFGPDTATAEPELSDAVKARGPFTVVGVSAGPGDVVRLQGADGTVIGWWPAALLVPAASGSAPPESLDLPAEGAPDLAGLSPTMRAQREAEQAAERAGRLPEASPTSHMLMSRARALMAADRRLTLGAALKRVSATGDGYALAERHREALLLRTAATSEPRSNAPAITLSADRRGSTLAEAVATIARMEQVGPAEALRRAARKFPTLAAAYLGRGE